MRLSQGLVEWVAVSAPPPVAAGGGAFHARGIMDGKSLALCLVGIVGQCGFKPLENKVKSRKTRTPPAAEAGGVRKESGE
jgi:hypothetical protein